MQPARSIAWLLAFTLVIASAATGCNRVQGDNRPVITVGYTNPASAAPLLVAATRPLPASASFRLAARRFISEASLEGALKSGEVSIAVVPLVGAVSLFARDLPVRIVSAVSESYGQDGIVGGSGIDSLEQLAGKRIGASDTSGAFFVWTMLSRAGLDPLSSVIEVRKARVIAAGFAAGEYEGAVLSGQALSQIAGVPDRKVLLTTKDFTGVLTDDLVVLEPFAAANPGVVQEVVSTIGSSAERLAKQPTARADAAALEASVSPASYVAALSGRRFFSLQDAQGLLGVKGAPGPLADVASEAAQFLADSSGLAQPSDLSPLIDSRYVAGK